MSNLKVTNVTADKWTNSDGTENFKCRAWVAFDSVASTLTILNSGNVSSVTDVSAGNFVVNLTKDMPHANYATMVGYKSETANDSSFTVQGRSTSAITLRSLRDNSSSYSQVDSTYFSLGVVC